MRVVARRNGVNSTFNHSEPEPLSRSWLGCDPPRAGHAQSCFLVMVSVLDAVAHGSRQVWLCWRCSEQHGVAQPALRSGHVEAMGRDCGIVHSPCSRLHASVVRVKAAPVLAASFARQRRMLDSSLPPAVAAEILRRYADVLRVGRIRMNGSQVSQWSASCESGRQSVFSLVSSVFSF